MLQMLADLEDSKAVNFAYHTTDPNVGMELSRDETKYKIFVGDTGLFITMAFWDKSYTENVIYDKLLSDKLSANLGYVYENLVAQMLTASGNKLFYYTWPKDDKHIYEIDFLLSRGSKIIPIVGIQDSRIFGRLLQEVFIPHFRALSYLHKRSWEKRPSKASAHLYGPSTLRRAGSRHLTQVDPSPPKSVKTGILSTRTGSAGMSDAYIG